MDVALRWKRNIGIAGLAILLGSSAAPVNASVQIIGYLGNFDVYNHTGSAMEGFEVDLAGLSVGDLNPVYPTYCGSAFGCGKGYNTSNGLGVVYDGNNASPGNYWQHSSVADGGVTHFGVHLNTLPTGNINYNWLDRNTGDNQLYIAGTNILAAGQAAPPSPPPAPAPVPQPVVITPDWNFNGATLTAVLRNTTNHPIWVQGVSAEDTSAVTLDQLMATNPLFSSLPMAEAQLLDPGDALTEAGDIAASSFGGRAMFWVYAYSGAERITDNKNGVDIFGQDCTQLATGCDFASMHGDLQSRMMTSVNVGEVAAVPVPGALPLFISALSGMFWLGRRKQIV
ncbi:hypothetical protein HC024_03255 [Methylococcaceae bacterium WWC4]|nr:hypothetical protein [Methylococcaceae bacterium WWC4]